MELFIYFQFTINVNVCKINDLISKSFPLKHTSNYKDSTVSEY